MQVSWRVYAHKCAINCSLLSSFNYLGFHGLAVQDVSIQLRKKLRRPLIQRFVGNDLSVGWLLAQWSWYD